MKLETCQTCGVVVNLDVFKEINDIDREDLKEKQYQDGYECMYFYCPCCKKVIYSD